MAHIRKPSIPELQAGRFAFLFVALVAIFLALPFLREGAAGDVLIEVMFLSVLFGSLRAVWGDRRIVIAAAIPGVGLLASPGWGILEPSLTSVLVSTTALVLFLAVALSTLGLAVYRATTVNTGTILGACSLYLLLGLFWFGVFSLIDILQDGSFAFVEQHADDVARMTGAYDVAGARQFLLERNQLFYFTFVTVTTLGYGDIRPVSDLARTYSTLAAISGQLFIAILVARLVGIQSAQAVSANESE